VACEEAINNGPHAQGVRADTAVQVILALGTGARKGYPLGPALAAEADTLGRGRGARDLVSTGERVNARQARNGSSSSRVRVLQHIPNRQKKRGPLHGSEPLSYDGPSVFKVPMGPAIKAAGSELALSASAPPRHCAPHMPSLHSLRNPRRGRECRGCYPWTKA
jgi:hypothetical protein